MSKLYPHLVPVDAAHLVGQFVLGTHNVPVPRGWSIETIGAWTLARHPALRAARLIGSGGEVGGWLLGMAVTPQGVLVGDTLRVESNVGWDAVGEQLAGELAGRFLIILVAGPHPRVYTDAFTMQGAVYAPELGLVASTTSVIPVGPATAFDVPRILAMNVPYTDSLYPLGLTPRRGIERVVPNHYLDLSTWRLVRRWPTSDVAATGDIAEAHTYVAAQVSKSIAALADAYPLQSPLTAGRDSRLVLACARPKTERMTFFTVELPGEITGWRDVHVAKTIARRFGLQFEVLHHRRARSSDLRAWLERTGGEAGEVRGVRGLRAFRQTARDRVLLDAWGADIVRPIYWKGVKTDHQVTASDILNRCEVPHLPEFVSRASRWLESLPTTNAITILDLLFAEQRGGCWAGVIRYAFEGRALGELPPFSHQGIVRRLMSLPVDYRRQGNFGPDVIANTWPDLGEIPYNEHVPVGPARQRYFDFRDELKRMPSRASRALREPAWIARKILGKLSRFRAS